MSQNGVVASMPEFEWWLLDLNSQSAIEIQQVTLGLSAYPIPQIAWMWSVEGPLHQCYCCSDNTCKGERLASLHICQWSTLCPAIARGGEVAQRLGCVWGRWWWGWRDKCLVGNHRDRQGREGMLERLGKYLGGKVTANILSLPPELAIPSWVYVDLCQWKSWWGWTLISALIRAHGVAE